MSEILVKIIRNIAGAEAVFEGHFDGVTAALAAAHALAGADAPAAPATDAKPEVKADTKKETPAPKADKKPDAKTASSQSGAKPQTTDQAGAAQGGDDTASGELDYAKDIRPLVVQVSTEKGREVITALLQRYGVAKGPELKPEQFAAFKTDAEKTLSGEYDPLASDIA